MKFKKFTLPCWNNGNPFLPQKIQFFGQTTVYANCKAYIVYSLYKRFCFKYLSNLTVLLSIWKLSISKLIWKISERHHQRRPSVFVINFEDILHLFLISIVGFELDSLPLFELWIKMLQPWNFVEYKGAQAVWLTVSYIYKNYVIKLHVKRKATAKVNFCKKLLNKSKTLLLKQTWVKSLFSVNKRFHYDIYEEKLSRDIKFCFEPVKEKKTGEYYISHFSTLKRFAKK